MVWFEQINSFFWHVEHVHLLILQNYGVIWTNYIRISCLWIKKNGIFPKKSVWVFKKLINFAKIVQNTIKKNGCIPWSLLTFLTKKLFFPQNAPVYRALFWIFCPIIRFVLTPKIPKELIFLEIAPIIQGTFLTFLPKNATFVQNTIKKNGCISRGKVIFWNLLTFLTFILQYYNTIVWF